MTKVTVRNTSPGFRGLNTETGYVELPAGGSAEVELSAAERKSAEKAGYFEFGGSAPADDEGGDKALADMTKAELEATATAEGVDISGAKNNAERVAAIETARAAAGGGGGIPPITPPADELDKMSDDDLRNTVQAITGKPAPADADRNALLKLARGEA